MYVRGLADKYQTKQAYVCFFWQTKVTLNHKTEITTRSLQRQLHMRK